VEGVVIQLTLVTQSLGQLDWKMRMTKHIITCRHMEKRSVWRPLKR